MNEQGGVVLEKNGQVVAPGAGATGLQGMAYPQIAAVLGHPAAALVAMIANHLARSDEEVAVSTLVLLGSITEALAVKPGDAVTFVLTPAMPQFSLRHLMDPDAERLLGRADRFDQRLPDLLDQRLLLPGGAAFEHEIWAKGIARSCQAERSDVTYCPCPAPASSRPARRADGCSCARHRSMV
jgi:hypothetical protein